ncbi:MAG: Imm53 family immunity protein [Hyphomicrobiaceae bacterium]
MAVTEQPRQLLQLLAWYVADRDDEWEHRFGIKLEPLEHNPGCLLIVDTAGTELADVVMLEQSSGCTNIDWRQWSFEPGSFRATGGERNLGDMIGKLFDEVERLAEVHRRS